MHSNVWGLDMAGKILPCSLEGKYELAVCFSHSRHLTLHWPWLTGYSAAGVQISSGSFNFQVQRYLLF